MNEVNQLSYQYHHEKQVISIIGMTFWGLKNSKVAFSFYLLILFILLEFFQNGM